MNESYCRQSTYIRVIISKDTEIGSDFSHSIKAIFFKIKYVIDSISVHVILKFHKYQDHRPRVMATETSPWL